MISLLSLQIMCIALVTVIACVVPGVCMVLRGVALMSDAISHAILLGIVLMFLWVHSLHSPLLIVGAAMAGVATVVLTELLIYSQALKKDAAIGLVFPLLFSIAVILISLYTRDVHLDVDMVLLGELAFAPFNRCVVYGVDCGPVALWIMGSIAALNVLFVWLFYKELAAGIFDPVHAQLTGCAPLALYYGLMTITSITAVGAFDVVGSIVVVALMITPAATAYLITYRLKDMFVLSIVFGIISALGGYVLAYVADVSIAGAIAAMSGVLFAIVYVCAPRTGLYTQLWARGAERDDVYVSVLCAYLDTQKGGASTRDAVCAQLKWSPQHVQRVGAAAQKKGIVAQNKEVLVLTKVSIQQK